MRSSSTRTIALVVLAMPGEPSAALNPFYFALLGALSAEASAQGYNLLVSFQDNPSNFRADFEKTREADGTIVIGAARNAVGWRHFREASRSGEHIVCWGAPNDAMPTIRCDNREGARLAVEHLVGLGRDRIAFVGPGWREQQAFEERRQGYLDVVKARGLRPIEVGGPATGSRENQGRAAAKILLEQRPSCDGVFAASDLIALGMLASLRERGVPVPDEIALVGFDGLPAVEHASPGLATVEQDSKQAGAALVRALLRLLNGSGPESDPVPMRLLTYARA